MDISQFGLEKRSAGVSIDDAALECRTQYPWTAAGATEEEGEAGLTASAFDELCRGYYLGSQTDLRNIETRTFPNAVVVIDPASERDHKGAK